VSWDALAAVAVTGAAFAQNVTISGNLNFSAFGNDKTATQTGPAAAATTAKTVGTGSQNGWTASQISFAGTEDLGGGLKASFTLNQNVNAGAVGMGDRDTNVALMGGFGTVRMGRFVPAAASGFHAFTGARTTNQAGSLYGSLLGAGTAQVGTVVGGSFERQPAVLQYTSPSFSGVTVNASYGKNGTDASATAGDANTTQTGLSISYAAGPLSIAAGTNQRKTGSEAVAGRAATGGCVDLEDANAALTTPLICPTGTFRIGTDGAAAVPAGAVKAKLNWVGASYNLGVATVMASSIRRTGDTEATGAATVRNTDIKTNAIGVAVPMGAYTLGASTYSGKNNQGTGAADDLKLSGHQLSVTYAMSKRTTVYAAMGENKTKRSGANVGATSKRTSNAIGLMHSF